MTDRYALVGNPVAHSKSPQIHGEFARLAAQDMRYELLTAPLDAFATIAERFRAGGGRGLNVTLPFKGDAFRYAGKCSERARAAQAVNTLHFDGGEIYGDNTDGPGLVNDVTRNLGFPIAGRRVLLLGAGGAARGVLKPLLDQKPAQLVIVNRTDGKAEQLARSFGAALASSTYAGLAGRQFDLVVNATSASISDALPPLPAHVFASGSLAYDMMYGKGETPFLLFAHADGAARLTDGLGMLVEQAAESFYVWRGVRPDTAPVIRLLRAG